MGRHRLAMRLGTLALLGGTLVPLTATSADASPGCLDETIPTEPNPVPLLPPIVTGDGCDDDTPPDTTLTAAPAPNANGFVSASTMTFTLGIEVTDGDAGPFGLECKLTGPAQAHDWSACSSPVTYSNLPDGAYGFAVRAVDLGDRPLNPDDGLPPTVVDTPDEDQTPATVTWTQDTKAPFVFVTGTSYDEITPTQPVVTGATVPIRLNSSEPGSTFECRDNDTPVACTGGRWELRDPRAGRHRFTARTIDRAGNASAWSEPIEFFVPRNLARQRGWKKVRGTGFFRGDALTASRRGARLVLPRTKVGELRLLASSGRGLGKVRVRVGRRDWHVVNLAGKRAASRQYVVIDRYSGMRAGKIVIESLSNKPVVLDAVVARPNRFPPAQ
jgi:hypothetical protein